MDFIGAYIDVKENPDHYLRSLYESISIYYYGNINEEIESAVKLWENIDPRLSIQKFELPTSPGVNSPVVW